MVIAQNIILNEKSLFSSNRLLKISQPRIFPINVLLNQSINSRSTVGTQFTKYSVARRYGNVMWSTDIQVRVSHFYLYHCTVDKR